MTAPFEILSARRVRMCICYTASSNTSPTEAVQNTLLCAAPQHGQHRHGECSTGAENPAVRVCLTQRSSVGNDAPPGGSISRDKGGSTSTRVNVGQRFVPDTRTGGQTATDPPPLCRDASGSTTPKLLVPSWTTGCFGTPTGGDGACVFFEDDVLSKEHKIYSPSYRGLDKKFNNKTSDAGLCPYSHPCGL